MTGQHKGIIRLQLQNRFETVRTLRLIQAYEQLSRLATAFGIEADQGFDHQGVARRGGCLAGRGDKAPFNSRNTRCPGVGSGPGICGRFRGRHLAERPVTDAGGTIVEDGGIGLLDKFAAEIVDITRQSALFLVVTSGQHQGSDGPQSIELFHKRRKLKSVFRTMRKNQAVSNATKDFIE